MFELEAQIRKWRGHLRAAVSFGEEELEELESHLRDSVDELSSRGLSEEEAFLVAVRRLGDAESLSREFGKVSTERVWRQLLVPADGESARRRQRTELVIVVALGVLAGFLGKIPALLGSDVVDENVLLYAKNAFLFALPPAAIYLIWKRALSPRFWWVTAAVFCGAALVANLYPSHGPHDTARLIAIHLPIALILFLGVLYGGPGWRRTGVRLDYVRFVGEVFIYGVLLGLGGGVLMGVSVVLFELIEVRIEHFVASWVVVFGGGALPVVAAYLVEHKRGRLETIAPVLARVFTPLFLVVLLALLIAMLVTGRAPSEDRELLIWFDLLLVVALALTLYTMSARDVEQPRDLWDWLTFALVAAALVVDLVALHAMVSRLVAYGATPNRVAALGENVLLLVNLGLIAVGYVRFLAGRATYQRIVDLQMRYLPVYAVWAAAVVVVFPPGFGFR